jgi:hypothetical protein
MVDPASVKLDMLEKILQRLAKNVQMVKLQTKRAQNV